MARAKYVKSRVVINQQEIDRLTNNMKQALVLTAEQLHAVVVQSQVMPRMDGTMQGEATFVDVSELNSGRVFLVTSTPYARRLYYHPEYNFHREPWEDESGKRHDGNPNARGKWYTEWLPGGKHGKDVPKWFQVFCKRLGG